MTNPISEKDGKLLALALKCAKAPIEIDYVQLAELGGFSNRASATTQWSKLRKRIQAYDPTTSDGAEGASAANNDGANDSVPATPVQGKKRAAPSAKGSSAKKAKVVKDESTSPVKKTAPRGKGVKRTNDSDEDVPVSPVKKTPAKRTKAVKEEDEEEATDDDDADTAAAANEEDNDDNEDSAAEEEVVKPTKAKKVKDPNAPKRGLSAYQLFTKSHRQSVVDANPGIKFGEVTQKVAADWSKISTKDKADFESQAALAKKRYTEEMAAYTTTPATPVKAVKAVKIVETVKTTEAVAGKGKGKDKGKGKKATVVDEEDEEEEDADEEEAGIAAAAAAVTAAAGVSDVDEEDGEDQGQDGEESAGVEKELDDVQGEDGEGRAEEADEDVEE